MRVLSKISWVAFMLPLLIWSCAPMDQPTIIPQTGSTLVSPAAGSSLVLLEAAKGDSITFQVTAPDFGVPGAVEITYKLEMAKGGTNFAKVVNLATTKTPVIKVKTEDLNIKALAEGLEAGKAGAVDFRVTTSINRSLSDLVGASSSLNVTPYLAVPPIKNLFLVGDATAAGWNNNNNNVPLFWHPDNPKIYYYVGYFAAGGFKVLEKLGAWQPQYGTSGGGNIGVALTPGPEPDPIAVATAGYYSLVFNLETNKYTLTAYTGDTSVEHASVGIIGDSTPGKWDNSTPMASRNFGGNQIWSITQTVTDGFIKFRANNTWAVNWGATKPIAGQAVLGSPDNIPIEAGSYNMWFNALDGRYLFIKQ